MGNPLDAIRGELRELRPRVERLEQAERVLAPSYDPPETQHRRRGAGSKDKPQRRRRRGSPTRAEILAFVIENGPVRRRDVLAGLGGDPGSVGGHLKRLFTDGEITADKEGPGRNYRGHANHGPRVGRGATAGAGGSAPPPGPPGRGVYPVYDALVELGRATTEQLVERTGRTKSEVVQQGRRLTRLGLVRFADSDGERVWTLVPTGPGR